MSLELKGDMCLHVSDPSLSRIKILLLPSPSAFGPELQFKQHPNVGKFSANNERSIALKDPSRVFPVNQSLTVLKWRYAGKDESYVPLSSECITVLASLAFLTKLRFGKLTAGQRLPTMAPAMSISNTNWRMRMFPFMTSLSPFRFRKW